MIAPMPSAISDHAPSVRLSVPSPVARLSAMSESIDLVLNSEPATQCPLSCVTVENRTGLYTLSRARRRIRARDPRGLRSTSKSEITATDEAPALERRRSRARGSCRRSPRPASPCRWRTAPARARADRTPCPSCPCERPVPPPHTPPAMRALRRPVRWCGSRDRRQAAGPAMRAHVGQGKIRLPDVDAVRGRHRRDVGAVVDDDAERRRVAALRHGVANHAEQVRAAAGFLTDL